jgi:ferric-dicitrate binding protein FerR (iron transport regulator)
MIDKQFQNLCVKAITGNITENEKIVLDNWLSGSSENRKEFEKMKSIWSKSLPEEFPSSIDLDIQWLKLYERLRQFEKNEEKRAVFTKRISDILFLPKFKPAFAVILFLAVIAAGIYLINRGTSEPQLKIISTLNKETKKIVLPDSSVVFMSGNSSLEFYSNFDKVRRLNLRGEAFFSVTKRKINFVVTTENAKITVMGTKFDVCSRDNKTRVVVDEGKVNFTAKTGSGGVNLSRNQLSVIEKKSPPTLPESVDSKYFLGWMDGKLVFYQTPLSNIVNQLEKHYNIKLFVNDDSLNKLTLTGSFKSDDADSALSIICLALGVDFSKQQNSYIIKPGVQKNEN